MIWVIRKFATRIIKHFFPIRVHTTALSLNSNVRALSWGLENLITLQIAIINIIIVWLYEKMHVRFVWMQTNVLFGNVLE